MKQAVYIIIILFLSACSVNIGNSESVIELEELSYENGLAYINGKLYSGKVIDYYQNGVKKVESVFSNGVENGELLLWDSLGNLLEKSLLKEGQLHGKFRRYYQNGQKMFEGEYVNGQLEGDAFQWYVDGEMKIEYHYEQGKEHGSYILYDREGVEMLNGQMKLGVRNGEWKELNPSTYEVYINNYLNGDIIDSKVLE